MSTSNRPRYGRKGVRESGVNYGATRKYSTSYRKARISRVRARKGRAKRNRFLYQLASLQNPQQTVSTPAQISFATGAGVQNWYSFDFAKGSDLRDLMTGNIAATATGAQVQDLRLYLKSFVMNYNITNVGSNACILEFYWLSPRYDIPDSEIPASGTTANDFATWLNNRYASGGDANLPDQKGDAMYTMYTRDVTLFQLPLVTRKFKILRSKKLTLGVGEVFSATEKLNSPQFLDYTDILALHYKKGLSMSLALRLVGYPTAATASGAASVSIALSEIQTSKVVNIRQSSQAVLPASDT